MNSALPAVLAEWTDWDVSAHALAQALGVFPLDAPMRDAKSVYWSSSPLGSSLSSMLEELAQVGILQKREEPDIQYRWSTTFRASAGDL